jgi:hypothetical protein
MDDKSGIQEKIVMNMTAARGPGSNVGYIMISRTC